MIDTTQFLILAGMIAGMFAFTMGGLVWTLRLLFDMKKEFSSEIKGVSVDMRSLDARLSRIEGYLEGYFGHSKRTGTGK